MSISQIIKVVSLRGAEGDEAIFLAIKDCFDVSRLAMTQGF